MKRIYLFLALLFALTPGAAHGVDGFNPPMQVNAANLFVVQPWDGKILVGGMVADDVLNAEPRGLMRLNPDGTVDQSFSTRFDSQVYSVTLLPDRSMIVTGVFRNVSYLDTDGSRKTLARSGMIRLYQNGAPDPFDFRVTMTSGLLPILFASTLLPDGKHIVVGGQFASIGGVAVRNLAKISIDPGSFGQVSADYPTVAGAGVRALAVQDDHRLLVGGNFTSVTVAGVTSGSRKYLMRLEADGTIDQSFYPTPEFDVYAFALQPDGKILIGGEFWWITAENGARIDYKYLARLTRFGEVDPSFHPAPNDQVTTLALQPDGRILVGGEFDTLGAVPRHGLARLTLEGAPDSFSPAREHKASVVAVQPDGKILVGPDLLVNGTGYAAHRIHRYYPDGTEDKDVAPTAAHPDDIVLAVALQPDGMTTIGGYFTTVGGVAKKDIARLKPDWSLAGPDQFNPSLSIPRTVLTMALQNDWMLWVGGYFWLIDETVGPARDPNLARFTATGYYDPAVDPASGRTMYQNVQALMKDRNGGANTVAVVPPGYPYAGMAYVGGSFVGDFAHPTMSKYHLLRLKPNGERDDTFNTPDLLSGFHGMYAGDHSIGRVQALAIQPDGKLLAGVDGATDPTDIILDRAVLVRFLVDGSLDPDFTPFETNGMILNISLQRDGKIIVSGEFRHPVQRGGTTLYSNIVRLNADGSLTDSLALEFQVIDPEYLDSTPQHLPMYLPYVQTVSLMGDGSMMISGCFDHLTDEQGTVVRDSVAKIFADGTVDRTWGVKRFDWHKPLDKVNVALVQPDGKVIAAGGYSSMDHTADSTNRVGRFANNTAAFQKLTVEPDGSRVSWLRWGSAPELWGVTFEDFNPVTNRWEFLGNGIDIDGGWRLPLSNPVRQQNRYLRARGFAVAGSKDSLLVEETLLYYLKPVLTVRPKGISRRYGAANPALEVEYLGFAEGDNAANALTGAPVLETAAGITSAVGDYAITAALGTLASGKYTFKMENALLTVTRAPLTVRAADATRLYGDPEPAPPISATGLVNGDTIGSVTLTSSAISTSPVGSTQTITPGGALFSSGSPSNYQITYQPGALTITRRPLVVRADNQYKSAGDPNPPLTASYTGFAPGEGAASLSGAPLITTTAHAGSTQGSYPIHIEGGTLSSGNYSFTFEDATFYVANPMPQTITFNPMRPHTYGDADFLPGATTTSNLQVHYETTDPAVAEAVIDPLGKERIRVKAPGTDPVTMTVTASQPGNWEYFAAESKTQPLTVHPPPGNGVSLDGVDDLIRVPHTSRIDFSAAQSFTVEGWLRLEGSQGDGVGILSKGGAGVGGYALLLQQNRVAARLGDGTLSLGPAGGLVGASSLDDGLWHQVALTVDRQGGVARLYLDGHLEAERALPENLGTLENGGDLLVGVDPAGILHLRGEVDELRLWDVARSREEIRESASQIIDPADYPHLVGFYHLDEGDAAGDNAPFAKAPDRTSFGNEATLSGLALTGASSNWLKSGAFAPLLETRAVLPFPPGGAVVEGILYPNYYSATQRGLCWGSDPYPDDSDPARCIGVGGGDDPFVVSIGDLTYGGNYHARAYAVNKQGRSWGNDLSFQAGKRNQTTTFDPLPPKTYGDPDFDPGGNSGSGNPLTYTSSDQTVATVVGDTIHIVGAGTTTITAKQGGDGTWNAAPDVPQLFTVLPAPLTVQAADKTRPYKSPDPPFTFGYSGFVLGEGAEVITGAPLLSSTAQWGSDAGSYPISVGIGTLFSRNYRFVLAGGTLSILRTGQCITFPLIGERTFGDDPFPVSAAACSGRTVSFASSDPTVIRVDGNLLTVVGTGTVTITARETGDGNHQGADEVSQTVVVYKSGQRVEFSSLAQRAVGDPPFQLSATASSGLPVSYESSDPSVATVTGSTVTIRGAGTVVFTALQEGSVNYNPATPVNQTLTVAQEGVPPLVLVSTLSSGSATANPVLNIEGVCRDTSGLASLTLNGAEVGGDFSLFSAPFLLSAGRNVVTLSALDLAGNRTTQSREILLRGSGPRLALSAPPDNSSTPTPQVVLSGSADEGSAVTVSVNGSTPLPLALSNGTFSATATLAEGVNTIEVGAEAGGVKSALKRSVLLAPGKPALAITEPAQDLRTEQGSLTLRGSASGAVQVSVQVNGTSYLPALAGGSFEQEIVLDTVGVYRVKATAAAADGSVSVAYRNVLRTQAIRGDATGDGVVDIGDARAVLALSLRTAPSTPSALSHADVAPLVNGVPQPDGVVDVGDVLVLLRKLVGLVDF